LSTDLSDKFFEVVFNPLIVECLGLIFCLDVNFFNLLFKVAVKGYLSSFASFLVLDDGFFDILPQLLDFLEALFLSFCVLFFTFARSHNSLRILKVLLFV